jgi:hypothetical protein
VIHRPAVCGFAAARRSKFPAGCVVWWLRVCGLTGLAGWRLSDCSAWFVGNLRLSIRSKGVEGGCNYRILASDVWQTATMWQDVVRWKDGRVDSLLLPGRYTRFGNSCLTCFVAVQKSRKIRKIRKIRKNLEHFPHLQPAPYLCHTHPGHSWYIVRSVWT